MEKQDEELLKTLIETDSELRECYQEHVAYERQIEIFNQKAHLSAEEEVERKRLQKLKLAGKDRMMEILYRHRAGSDSPQH
jgi:hypothetical protein